MLNRRALLTLTAFTFVGTLVRLKAARADPDAVTAASDFINRVGSQLVAIVNSSASLSDKQHQLQPAIDKDVDVDGIARFCLGRFWRTATPEQQKSYVQLFHAVLVNSITGKLGDYQGVKFTMGRAHPTEDGVIVSTTIQRPNNAPNSVDWLVVVDGGTMRIADMIAEGTSLRLTQRSDYASYLAHNNNDVQALIDALHRQLSS
jgi:phospholipid transport system substrate-binding protein